MNKLLRKLKSYTKLFLQIALFVLTAVALYFILPGEPKFKYEYQKGFPWRHENLVAPFDFAILKSANELEDEKAEQISSLIPYFTNDTTIKTESLTRLQQDLELLTDSTNTAKKEVYGVLADKLAELYSNGILQFSIDTYSELQGKEELNKRTGNSVQKVATDKLYSEKSAYNTLLVTRQELENSGHNAPWLNDLILDRYITANLSYDSETSQKEIDELTQNISAARGMVKLGERIVLEGEIVDAAKFQVLESLKASYEQERGNDVNRYMVSGGKILLISVLLSLLFVFLLLYRRDILEHLNKLSFMLLLMAGIILLSNFINTFPNLHIYMVPLAVFPIMIRTFFDSRTAIFTLIITTLLIGFYAPNNYEFILLQVSAGMIAVFSLNKMHRRVHLVLASLWVFLTYAVVFAALNLIHEGTFIPSDYADLKWFAISSVLILLVYPLVYIFEKLFGFVSDVTLIEISDSNQPLLRKLAEQAPGTFQHSMQIANLAEEVILRIGGNPFLVRAGALYHDIGKIGRPNFFIENQALGMNPHDRISHLKSAEVIIDHVRNGVKMAQKHKLPAPIIEFIATHHGTTKAKYFYLKHQEQNPDQDVDEKAFIYPGPLPRSKEAAVVMLVDGIEAASRSMKEKTHENLKALIDSMIDKKIEDKQLVDSDLTFRDIDTIKKTLLEKLINIYHIRIEYPEEKNKK
ncbi:HDIG domain-containing protein [Draconibacterium sp. IB214405]|uniref:HD family phosphohydrolase n=1 Tax=Draconibacterium sp. IB214405 TaxID=3097352 RepID=UPI002A1601A4|nr:HDIG domain-containing metalloprotein [Draconibacterium sp. IB214405]MDX8340209.1 HDIG domain-containing protein [Draconibacterium sp. IB214405]